MKKKSIFVLLLTTLTIGSAVPAAAAPYCGGRGPQYGGRGPQCGQNYIDADGNGICDNFVDQNGDGINDNCPGYGQGAGRGQGQGQGLGQRGTAAASPVQNTVVKKTGTKKNTIKKVQRKLNKIGYRCGKVNGVMNAKTKKALKDFKKTKGLKVNSALNRSTLKALRIS